MAEPQKPSWWSTLPGILTAATGFVAALTGLIATLNQLGVFRRDEAVRQEVTAAAPQRTVRPAPEEDTATRVESPPPAAAPRTMPRAAPAPLPAPSGGPTGQPAAPTPVPAAPETTRTDTAADRAPGANAADTARSAPARRVIPSGTRLSLAGDARACAPETGQQRLAARVTSPVLSDADTLVPAGAAAVLRLRRRTPADGLELRLDSLSFDRQAVVVRRAQVSLRRPGGSSTCVPAGARMTAVLGAAVTLDGR